MPALSDIVKNVANTVGAPKFKKRVNPHGRDLRKNNKYYKEPLNECKFNSTTGGNCVWYAYGRFKEVWDQAPEALKKKHPWPGKFHSNGVTMVKQAKATGFKTGLTPKVGAIISWGKGSLWGNSGHVAFVEDVHLNSAGKIESIEISHSSWHNGDMKNMTLKPGTGQQGSGGYHVWNNYYFNGFAYNPIDFAGTSGVIQGSEGSVDGGTSEDDPESTGFGIDFAKRASKLSSSDNFEFIQQLKDEESPLEKLGKTVAESFKTAYDNFKNMTVKDNTFSGSCISDRVIQTLNLETEKLPRKPKQKSYLSVGDNTVEAPFIEAVIAGYKIGSYRGDLDEYPNYISQLNVTKQNGVINQYKLQLIHQVRPGEDSNLLDELLSKTNYNPIEIKYGDLNTNQYFQDTRAIITNVDMTRNYTSMSIAYTIEALSEGSLLQSKTVSFPAVTAQPSTVIRSLLYENQSTSQLLLEAFPGMQNKTFVDSNNLIPNNDSEVEIQAQYDVNVIDYMNYLVGCMSNQTGKNEIIRNSTYYITYNDTDNLNSQGAYFKIAEVTAGINPFAVTNKVYDITVGYNDNIVYDFTVESTKSWELLYKSSTKAREYAYTITNNGDLNKYYSPSVASSTNPISEVNKNWWTQMIKFPLTASITIKGLLKPIMLMDYIRINVVFYGQQHITSGIYAITGQQDILSGSGFKTTLSLVRVTEDG